MLSQQTFFEDSFDILNVIDPDDEGKWHYSFICSLLVHAKARECQMDIQVFIIRQQILHHLVLCIYYSLKQQGYTFNSLKHIHHGKVSRFC